jgi:hypothetical protein
MQMTELDRSIIGVANRTDLSSRATADEKDRGLRIGKRGNLRRLACSTLIGSLMAAGLVFTLAPRPARADEDNDIHRGGEDNDKGIRAEIAALQAQVASLRSTVSGLQVQASALQTANTSLQNGFNNLQSSNVTLETQLATVKSNRALLLGQFVNVDFAIEKGVRAPNIIFSGANIHIESGSGATDDHGNPTGLGNLIIGYDEDPINPLIGDSTLGLPTIMQTSGSPSPLNPGDRGGSHNLVIGSGNRFTQAAFGGFVAGQRNAITSFGASVVGGYLNSASGLLASVSGGIRNGASGLFASVSSGGLNNASGTDASVSGGFENSASGAATSVSGGNFNTATGLFSSVGGGDNNTAGGFITVVLGGSGNTDNNFFSIAPQPPFP